jgi:hypothetical protein
VKSCSSRRRTSRYTIHARSRTSRISRKHSAVIARPAQGRSSSDLGRWDVIVAIIAPWEQHCLGTPSCGPLPLGFCWQPIVRAGHRGKPRARCNRVVPGNRHHRLLRMREAGIAPERGRRPPGGFKKARILINGHLGRSYVKGVYPNAMDRRLDILTGVGPHGEPASRDVNSQWLGDWHETGDWIHSGRRGHLSIRC